MMFVAVHPPGGSLLEYLLPSVSEPSSAARYLDRSLPCMRLKHTVQEDLWCWGTFYRSKMTREPLNCVEHVAKPIKGGILSPVVTR